MRKVFMMVSLIALTVNLVEGREKEVLSQQAGEEAVYTDGIKVNLTQEDIQEALTLGAQNRGSKDSGAKYYFGTREGYEEYGYLTTKFSSLVGLGWGSAKEHKKPDRFLIDYLSRFIVFGIEVVTYGDEIDFAKNYHIVLKQGGMVIRPEIPFWEQMGEKTPCFPESPSYKALVTGLFPYSEIDPKAKTTIILIKDRGESTFEVDFSRYK